jgi:hypothetical protein
LICSACLALSTQTVRPPAREKSQPRSAESETDQSGEPLWCLNRSGVGRLGQQRRSNKSDRPDPISLHAVPVAESMHSEPARTHRNDPVVMRCAIRNVLYRIGSVPVSVGTAVELRGKGIRGSVGFRGSSGCGRRSGRAPLRPVPAICAVRRERRAPCTSIPEVLPIIRDRWVRIRHSWSLQSTGLLHDPRPSSIDSRQGSRQSARDTP